MSQVVMVYVYVMEYVLHWGFSVRTPFMSGAQGSYRIPPPTTIVGALACAYFMNKGSRREVSMHEGKLVSRVVEFVKRFGIKYAICTCFRTLQFQSVMRYLIGFYLAREMYEDLRRDKLRVPTDLFGPVSFGYVSSPAGHLLVVLVSKEEIEEEVFYSVTRIGSRESVVCINPKSRPRVFTRSDLTLCRTGDLVTDVKFAFPREIAHDVKGVYIIEQHFMPCSEQDFVVYYAQGPRLELMREVVVPVLMSEEEPGLEVDIGKECYMLNLDSRGGTLQGTLLIPREVLQR